MRPGAKANGDGHSSWSSRARIPGPSATSTASSATAVAELGPDDLKGPVSVAVAAELDLSDGAAPVAATPADAPKEEAKPAAKKARLVVFGDSDFASNELIEAYRNRDLFLNTVNWLLGDVEAISIRPNKSRASRFQLSQEQFLGIRSLSLFVLPEVIGVLGVLAWWSRRRPPEHG